MDREKKAYSALERLLRAARELLAIQDAEAPPDPRGRCRKGVGTWNAKATNKEGHADE